ncbi:chemotaxis protein CheB [Ideonella sp. YS5]|uniref:chemotaxis protein CheB n=1 Tax=Ideonella sp. YS5 TaxID=3453714 RepID=UPI003EE9F162
MTERKSITQTNRGPARPPAPNRQQAVIDGGEDPQRDDNSSAHAVDFPIVGIGASAGGLAAMQTLFSALPPEGGGQLAFVLVQHLSPDHKSSLAELLTRQTRLPAHEATDGVVVQPNCIYVIPPGHDMALADGRLCLRAYRDAGHRPQLTVDHFFSSLAAAQRDRAIAVVLSGTGSDGSMGVREIKAEGGLVIAQAPESAEHGGMPQGAIDTGMVDYVLPPEEIPGRLLSYVNHLHGRTQRPVEPVLRESALKTICMLLRAQTGHDFSQYKETTLVRRMERRMALHQVVHPEDYVRFAREDPQEIEALFRDLLIGVTHFFRDPEAFQVVQEKVIARRVAQKAPNEPMRVWVCGCSTGEEAYSIAILLYEQMLAQKRSVKLQLFASDIDMAAIEYARNGVYPASIADHVDEERLHRFFTPDSRHGTYRVQKHIRDLVVFSRQDVIKDPPFSRVDLVSCRNLLIYLNGDLQRRLIPLFHYALVPGGALFLGTSETVGESARLFHVVDRKWKIFTRLPGDRPTGTPLPNFVSASAHHADPRHPATRAAEVSEVPANLRQVTERALLAHHGGAGVLVNARGQILHIVGRTGQFLEPSDGDASMNILGMAREGLRRALGVALRRVVATMQDSQHSGLAVPLHGGTIHVDMALRTVQLPDGLVLYLVVLEEAQSRPDEGQPPGADGESSGHVAELERELRAKEEYLQATLEEMESTNEELKSTNEEMQSVNEELSTVNAELRDKVADLSRADNDMNNLLAGTGDGTVFVDHELRIVRFTPAATQVINLIPTDVGRPLEHVVTNLVGYDRMIEDIRTVRDTLVPAEAEVQIRSGAWYLMRIRPYRTAENRIEGVVVTLVEISARKQAEDSLRRSEARLSLFINQAYAGVCETDFAGRITFANDRLCETLGYPREELLGRRIGDLTDPADLPLVQAEARAVSEGGPYTQFEKRWVRKDGSRLRTLERVSAIRDAWHPPASLLWLSFEVASREDLTKRER